MFEWIQKHSSPTLTQHGRYKLGAAGLVFGYLFLYIPVLYWLLAFALLGHLFHKMHREKVLFDQIHNADYSNLIFQPKSAFDATDSQGYTPLHCAILNHNQDPASRLRLIEWLLRRISPSACQRPAGPDFQTPLHLVYYADIKPFKNDRRLENRKTNAHGQTAPEVASNPTYSNRP